MQQRRVIIPVIEWCTDGQAIAWINNRVQPVHSRYVDALPDNFRMIDPDGAEQGRLNLWTLAAAGALSLGITKTASAHRWIEVISQRSIIETPYTKLFVETPPTERRRDGTLTQYELPILVDFRQLIGLFPAQGCATLTA